MHPVLGGMGPDVHRDLPVLDVATGKLALTHATLGDFRHTFGDARSFGLSERPRLTSQDGRRIIPSVFEQMSVRDNEPHEGIANLWFGGWFLRSFCWAAVCGV